MARKQKTNTPTGINRLMAARKNSAVNQLFTAIMDGEAYDDPFMNQNYGALADAITVNEADVKSVADLLTRHKIVAY
jgi:hypothetical protein